MKTMKKLSMLGNAKLNRFIDKHMSIEDRFDIAKQQYDQKITEISDALETAIANRENLSRTMKDNILAMAKLDPETDAEEIETLKNDNKNFEEILKSVDESITFGKESAKQLLVEIKNIEKKKSSYIARVKSYEAAKAAREAVSGITGNDEFSITGLEESCENELSRLKAQLEVIDFKSQALRK